MADQFVRLDMMLFAIFLLCGWLVMLIGPPDPLLVMRPARRRLVVIGAPIFAALCVFFAVKSGPLASADVAREHVLVVLTPLFALAAVGSIIAVPLAVRARQQQVQHVAHQHGQHHQPVHAGHTHDGEAGHSQHTVRATWIPRQRPPREE